MNIGAELWQYIVQTQFKKSSEDSMGEFERPSGYAGGLT